MTARSLPVAAISLAATLLWFSGCGGGGGPSLVPVTGNVTLNGEPLEGATVFFTPAGENTVGAAGMDSSGPEGNFKIQTKGRAGLPPGKYLVVVSKENSPALANAAQFQMVDPEGNPIGEDLEMARLAAGDSQDPATAAAAKTTKVEETFEREVPPEGTTFDFDLKASAGEAKILRGN